MEPCDGSCGQRRLALGALRPGPGVRHRLDDDWIAVLVEEADELAPIVVHCPARRVVDGQHRLAAARRRSDTTIPVTWYHGASEDLYGLAVRRNAGHGLALTRQERRDAAAVLLRLDPRRSDRAIARTCGLSPTTVGKVRAEVGPASDELRHVVGHDGKRYPVGPTEPPRRTPRRGPLGWLLEALRRVWRWAVGRHLPHRPFRIDPVLPPSADPRGGHQVSMLDT